MDKLDYYQLVRPHMQTMDLLQWSSNSFVGRAIKWKTGGTVNHSGVVMSFPDLTRERRWTLEAIGRGLVLNPLSRALEQYHGECYWHPVKPGLDKEALFAASWMMDRVGTRYDFGGLFRNLFGKVSANAAALFCSEAIFLGWQYAAIHLGVEILKHLIQMKKAPVPADMPLLKIYRQQGTRIL